MNTFKARVRDTMLANLIRDLTGRVDEDLPPYVLGAMSIDVTEYREALEQLGHAFIHVSNSPPPSLEALNKSAKKAISRSARKASIVGAAGGVAGFFGVPPEVAARIIQSVRLAQRLAIIYGHDPSTDRGAMHVRRALAAGWEFDLPAQTKVDFRLSDLPTLVRSGLPATSHRGGWLAQTLMSRAASSINSRVMRFVPGLGLGLGAFQAHKATRSIGVRMQNAYLRSYRHPKPTGIEDAIEA